MDDHPTTAELSYQLSGLFEAELLVELMLRHWGHPFAADRDFRQELLESAVEVLRASIGGQKLIPELDPSDMNLVAAIWCVESTNNEASEDLTVIISEERRRWCQTLMDNIPSCFTEPEDLL